MYRPKENKVLKKIDETLALEHIKAGKSLPPLRETLREADGSINTSGLRTEDLPPFGWGFDGDYSLPKNCTSAGQKNKQSWVAPTTKQYSYDYLNGFYDGINTILEIQNREAQNNTKENN